MDGNDEASQTADCKIVQPHVTLADLQESDWIGIGAAIEWIAMRGKPMTLELYRQREDEADAALVATFANMLQNGKSVVMGEDQSNPGELKPIPIGIWLQTATSDFDESGKPYRLIGMDEYSEWGGAIVSLQVPGYRRVQVRTGFIQKHWPEHGEKMAAPSARNVVSRAQLRRLIEMICRDTSIELAPLTQAELIELVKRRFQNAPRDTVHRIYKELRPDQRPGPRGPRSPDRQRQIAEFGENLIAAQLHN